MQKYQVTKAEFETFVKEYPKPLQEQTIGFCTPRLHAFYDFSIKPRSFESTVAEHSLIEECSQHYPHVGTEDTYHVWK